MTPTVNKETQYYEYPTLYRKDKFDRIRMWKISIRLIKKISKKNFTVISWNMMDEIQVPIQEQFFEKLPDDIIAEYWMETGIVDGKITRSIPTYPEEKNIGRSNYRDSFKQAIFVADSMFKKKIDEGFSVSLGEEILVKGVVRVFPMLARNYTAFKKRITFPVYVQPKLDGLRCVAFLDPITDKVVLQSRTKKDYPSNEFNDSIKECLYIVFKTTGIQYLDGELYNHNIKLQTLNHYSRQESLTNDNNADVLQYWIYDTFDVDDNTTFKERYKRLCKVKPTNSLIHIVDTKLVYSQNELEQAYQDYVELGYEGMMIRSAYGQYAGNPDSTTATRSIDLLKMKQVFSDEYIVIDYTEGVKGKDKNAIIWICSTPEGNSFKVVPNLTYEDRYELFKRCKTHFQEEFKNRWMTVEYRTKSLDNIPQHGKGLGFRDVE